VFYILVKTGSLAAEGVDQILKDWKSLVPSATFVFTSVLNELLPPNNKARVVFWRWHDPLLGNRAFTTYAQQDARVDLGALSMQLGALPKSPHEQNALWYKLYRSIADDPSIVEIHPQRN